MKYKQILLIPLFILMMAFSCENKEDMPLTKAEKQIIGEWNWLESIYYYTISGVPYVINPDTLGYKITYLFDNNDNYKIFRNSSLDSEGVYWFETIQYENGTDSPLRLFTQEDGYIKSVNFSFSGDTLFFDETEVDGAKRIFVRAE
jgi:hypothetical protein